MNILGESFYFILFMDTFLPGSASLIDSVDKLLLVILRDGRHLAGTLRSYDQFANLVLQDCHDLETKIKINDSKENYLIRGENVVLLGEVRDPDLLKEFTPPKKDNQRVLKDKVLKNLGFSVEESFDSY
jgi:small nuclear ribonucleoprotein (snRNP)-like protein